MNIVKPHKTPSLPVTDWRQIASAAEELKGFIVTMPIVKYPALALHHAQVSEHPYNFFVIHPEAIEKFKRYPHHGLVKDQVIVNPEIIDTGGSNDFVSEGCMSFQGRGLKKLRRWKAVEVRYQVPARGVFGVRLKQKQAAFTDVIAQVFQHETEHGKGRNIYDGK